jgi:hypothetical protein
MEVIRSLPEESEGGQERCEADEYRSVRFRIEVRAGIVHTCLCRHGRSRTTRRRRRSSSRRWCHIQIWQRCRINGLLLPLPVLNMLQHNRRSTLRRILSANALNKVTFRVHNIEVNAVIHEVIFLTRLEIGWRREVNSILLADVLGLFPCSRQAQEGWVELGEVRSEDRGSVSCGIAGDENTSQAIWFFRLDNVDRGRHLVEFIWADVGAMGEAEVDLL